MTGDGWKFFFISYLVINAVPLGRGWAKCPKGGKQLSARRGDSCFSALGQLSKGVRTNIQRHRDKHGIAEGKYM